MVYARLTREPFNQPLSEVANLTDAQIIQIFGLDLDNLPSSHTPSEHIQPPQTEAEKKDAYFTALTTLGIPTAQIQKEWDRTHGKPQHTGSQ